MKRRLRTIAPLVLITALLLGGQTVSMAKEVLQEITVVPGDTMWSIANKYLKDPKRWPEIIKNNKELSNDPTVALPGTKIKVPILLIKEEYRNAHLIKLIPEVRLKRKGGRKWRTAKKDMTIQYEESLRTMKGAEAHVQFPTKEIVKFEENTYVVIKPDKILQEIQLIEGNIRASQAKVIMPQGTVVKPRSSKSDFQAKVRSDETEVVFVYKGKVDVTARGKTVTVKEGFGTEVPKFSAPKKPMPLPSFKDFDPKALTVRGPLVSTIKKRQGTITVKPPTLKPKGSKSGKKSKAIVSPDIMVKYHLELATDEAFKNIVHSESKPTGAALDIKNLPVKDGTYFLRVAFIDALGVQGNNSQPTKIIKDTIPPKFNDILPKEGHRFFGENASCDVSGLVKGAAVVAVNDEVIFINESGNFSQIVFLKEGPNLITVKASDANGNETVIKRKVSYSKIKSR